ncbi:MAG: hypothetical protein AB7G17_00340 [Phycisphaerales bacterium]
MKIAVLGWGSLLWHPHGAFDSLRDDWRCGEGPELKVEFSRISKSRAGALTLVIDQQFGTEVTVAWCYSTRTRLDDAICDLRCREGTSLENIGRLEITTPGTESGGSVEQVIGDWARQKKICAVVWTALPSNFETKQRKEFSVVNALEYLAGLDSCGRRMAYEYFSRAPKFVNTPLRREVEKTSWYLEAAKSL